MRLPPLHQLQAFESAARHLSFKAAAEELHVTPTAISHSIGALESDLGVRLFRRLTRALELTEEGRAALPKLREGFEALREVVRTLRPEARVSRIVVVAPPSFAQHWLVPRLHHFTAACPDTHLSLATSADLVDADEEGADDPMGGVRCDEGDVLMAVRFGSGRYPGFRVVRLFSVAYLPVCSPRLVKGKGGLRRPDDLRRYTLLHDDAVRADAGRPSWQAWLKLAGVEGLDARRGPRFATANLALEAAADGLGVALVMRELAAGDIAEGRLVAPFPVVQPSRFAYYLVCAEDKADLPEALAFRDALLRELQGEPA